jgi:hypothetical protein
MKQMEKSMKTRKVHLEMLDMFSISYSENMGAIV